ncbi:tetratricopeptide repeat protein [Mesorhizobium sp. 10J20-29]
MRQGPSRWLLRLAAVAGMALSGPVAHATTSDISIEVSTFSGAYLAARVAEVDNDLDGAITFYKKALAFDPENQALQQSIMLALISQGRFDESLPYAEKLKTVAEVERFSRLALAIDGFRKEDYKAAEAWLKLALESDLDALVSKVLSAWAKSGGGNSQGAVAMLDELAGPQWYGLFVSYNKALIADAAGLNDQADAAYQEATGDMASAGSSPETWLRAAEAYARFLARTGDKAAALAMLDKGDEFASGRLPLVKLREKISRDEPVERLVATPSDGASELLFVLASALNRAGGESFVRLYLQYALALKPDSDVVLIQLAGLAEQQRNAEDAIALYRRIPDTSPLKRLSQLQLGLNLADLDRRDEAIAQLKSLVSENPDDMRGYLALGGVYSSKEDYASSAALYDKAVARIESQPQVMPADPRSSVNWNVYYQRGIAYERLKQWPKAEPNFRRAMELYPDQPQVLNYLGYSWIDMNINLEEGIELIRKAVELRPSDGYIVDSLGWAHYRLGQYEEAVRELERAVSLKPDDPVLNDHLGDAYWRAGRRLEATFQWSHARDMKPEPAVLAEVEKKLAEGLPPLDDKAMADTPSKTVLPAEEPAPAHADQRTELAPQDDAAQVVPVSYKVSPGQSLWSIAADELGSGSRYIEILDLNPQLRGDPGRLMPGQELTLPGASR